MTTKSDPSSDGLPTYFESTSSTAYAPSTTLPQSLTAARTSLILSLISTHITPHLHSNALTGLSSTTLLLVPSNVSSLQPSSENGGKSDSNDTAKFQGEAIVGFPSAENLTLIRLTGQESGLEFWQQPVVIRELDQRLRMQLQAHGHRVVSDDPEEGSTSPKTKESGGFFKRKSSNTDWRTVQKENLAEGEVKVVIELKEICLRIENAMGLYETKTGKAIVIRVNVGD